MVPGHKCASRTHSIMFFRDKSRMYCQLTVTMRLGAQGPLPSRSLRTVQSRVGARENRRKSRCQRRASASNSPTIRHTIWESKTLSQNCQKKIEPLGTSKDVLLKHLSRKSTCWPRRTALAKNTRHALTRSKSRNARNQCRLTCAVR